MKLILSHTQHLSLLKGNVVNRFLELRAELKLFLEMQEKQDFCFFKDPLWKAHLAYFIDILVN